MTSSLRITGKLSSAPELRQHRSGPAAGRHVMTVRIRQEQGLPYVASTFVGEGPMAVQAATLKAMRMEVGQVVTVTGTHIDITGTKDGAIALLVQGVTDIVPHLPRHHSEASTA